MTFASVDSSGGEMFPQHPRSGNWETLKGSMLSPHIQAPMQSDAMGDSRHIDESPTIPWNTTILVNTGETRGGGTMAH